MEAINKYYLNNGTIYPIKKFTDEDSKEKIIYEVLRVVNGKPAFLKVHLERMKKSFKLINKEKTVFWQLLGRYCFLVILLSITSFIAGLLV